MTRPNKLPWVFRISAALLVGAIVLGGWWQRQPAGATGRAFLTSIARVCPAAAVPTARPTVADTAHALDRASYALLGNLVFGGHDRCAREVTR